MEIFRFILGLLLSFFVIQGNGQSETRQEITDSTTLVLLEPSRTVSDLDIPTSGLGLLTLSAPKRDTLLSAITDDTSEETSSTPAQLETSFNEALTSSTLLPSLGSDQSSLSGALSRFQLSRTDIVVDSSPSNSFVSSRFVIPESSIQNVESSSRSQEAVSPEQYTSTYVLPLQASEQAASSSTSENDIASSSVSQEQAASSFAQEQNIAPVSVSQDQTTRAIQEQISSSSLLQEQITSSSVLQDQTSSSSMLQEQISSSAALESQLASSSVSLEQETSSSVLQDQLASSSVLQEQISSSAALESQLTSSSVLQEQISSSAALESQLTSSSVSLEQETSSSVLQDQLASSSVLQEQISSSAALESQLASSSVLQEPISSSAALESQLASSSVSQEQETSSSVLQDQLASSSVLQEQISSSASLESQLASSSVSQEQISSSAALESQLASSSVSQEQISSSAALESQLTSSSVLQEQISASSVQQDQSTSSSLLQERVTSISVLQGQLTSSSVLQEQTSTAILEEQLTLQTTGQIPPSSYSAVQSSVSSGQNISTSVSPVLSGTPGPSTLLFSALSELSSASASSTLTASSAVPPASAFDGTEVLDSSSAPSFGDQTSLISTAIQDISEGSNILSETPVPLESSFQSPVQPVLNTFHTTNIDSTESLILTNTVSSMQSSEGTPSSVSVKVDSFSFVSTNVQSSSEITTPSQIPEKTGLTSDNIFATSTDSPTLSISLSAAATYDASSVSTSILAPVSEDVILSLSYELSTLHPQSSSSSKTTVLFDSSSALPTFGLTSEILYTTENSVEFQVQTETPSIDTTAFMNSLSDPLSRRQSENVPSLSISDSSLASSFPQQINLATESVTSTLEILSSRIDRSSYQPYGSSYNVQSVLASSVSPQETIVISESLFSSESSDATPTAGVLESSFHQSDTTLSYTLSSPNTGSTSSSNVVFTDASIQESSFTEYLIPSQSIVSTVMSNTESVQPTFRTPDPTDSVVLSVVSVESSPTHLASMSFTPRETSGILTSSSLETSTSSLFPSELSSIVDVAFSSSEVSHSQRSTGLASSSLYEFSSISSQDSGSVGSSATYVFLTMPGSTVQTDLLGQASESLSPSTEIFFSSQSVIVLPSVSDISSSVSQTQLSSSVQRTGSSDGTTLLSDSLSTSSEESVLGTVQLSTSVSERQSIASSSPLPIIIGSDTATGIEPSTTYISDSLYASESVTAALISSQLLPETTDIPRSRFQDSTLLMPSVVDISIGSPFSTVVSTPSFTFPNPPISTGESASVTASFEFSTVLNSSTDIIVILSTIEQSSAISSFDISLLEPSSSLFGTQSLSGFSDIVLSNVASMSYAASSLSASESELISGPLIPIITSTESQTIFFSHSTPTELLPMTATKSQSFTVSTSLPYDFSSVLSSREDNSTSVDTTRPSTLLFSHSPTLTGSSAFQGISSDLSTDSSLGGIVLPTFSGSSASDIVPSGSDVLLTSTGRLFASDASSDSGGFVPVPTTLLPGSFSASSMIPFVTESSIDSPSQAHVETSVSLSSLPMFDTSTSVPSQEPFGSSTNLLSMSLFDTSSMLPTQGPFDTSTNLPSMSLYDTSSTFPTQGPFETSPDFPSSIFDTISSMRGHFETSTSLLSISSLDTNSMLPLSSPFETSTTLPSMSLFDTSTIFPNQGSFGTSTILPSPSSFDSSTNLPSEIPFETRTNLPTQSSFLTSFILPTQSLSETSLLSPSPSFSPSSPVSSSVPVLPTGSVSSLSIISSQEYTDISSLLTRSDISTPSALMSQISATESPQFVSSTSVEPSETSSDTFGPLSSDLMESSTISISVSSSMIISSTKYSYISSVILQTTGTVLGSSLFSTTISFAEISVDISQIPDSSSVPVTVLPSLSRMVSESISISGVTSLESRLLVDSSLQSDSTTFVPTDILSSSISSSPSLLPSSSVIISESDTNVIFSSSVSMVSSSQTESIVSVDTSTPTDIIPTIVPSSAEPSSSSETDLSSSLIPSPTSSPSVTPSSSVLPSVPTTTPSLNTSDALKEFWVNTVIKVRQSEDVSSAAFKDKMEERLAAVYEEAFTREQMIKNGTYQPLKRRKRYASSPDGSVKLQVVNVERQSTSNNVKLTYLAEKDGKMVPSDKMVDALELLDHQEVALGLGYVVDTKAEPYVPIPVQPPADDRKLWIIAAVLGPIALIIIIWIIICIACRCCNRKTGTDAEEPHLMKVRRDGAQVQSEASGAPPDYPPEQGSKRGSSVGLIKTRNKKMSYEVNPDPDEESTLYPEVKKLVDIAKTNGKKKHPASSPRSEANDSMTYVSEDDRYATPARRKGKKQRNIPREADDSSSQIDNVAEPNPEELRTKPLPIPRHNKQLDSKPPTSTQDSMPPASAQEEEELLERAEMERLRNKQRLREQRKRERSGNTDPHQSEDHEVRQGYKKAQKEIDAVLGSPDQDNNLPDVFVHKPKKRSSRRKKDPQEGHTNEAFTEDEHEGSSQSGESLDEAKRRMHKLLDDAFSLISSSRSSMGNKVTPVSSPTKASYTSLSESRKKDDVTPRANGSVPTESKESKQPAEEEKKHTPLYYNPTYTGQEEGPPRLETWSPYRAADEVALISLPQTQTVIDKTPTQERLQTTTFSESYPTSMRDSYYATEPAKPIVIRTKDLDPDPKGNTNSKPSHPKHQTVNGIGTGTSKSGLPNGDTSYPGMTGYEDIPLHSFGSKSQTQDSLKENGGLNGGPHKGPTKTWAGQDELDVVSSLEPGASPRPFIRSLREELEHLSTKIGEPGKTDSHANALA
ncbi:streptococcal hemagglutinin-like [Haliotis asinina]|uniref:streptococcal hemagglutinin-like n=1 Tax=Haliotis asinina TaxID=109174 RepID=UPI003531B8C1